MAVGTPTHPPLWGQAPPLPANAFAHLTSPPANTGPVAFPLEMPEVARYLRERAMAEAAAQAGAAPSDEPLADEVPLAPGAAPRPPAPVNE